MKLRHWVEQAVAVARQIFPEGELKFLAWLFPLHNGEAFGLTGRWLVCVGIYSHGTLRHGDSDVVVEAPGASAAERVRGGRTWRHVGRYRSGTCMYRLARVIRRPLSPRHSRTTKLRRFQSDLS